MCLLAWAKHSIGRQPHLVDEYGDVIRQLDEEMEYYHSEGHCSNFHGCVFRG